MQLKVWKYDGAGNDFVAIDGREESVAKIVNRSLVRALCDRRRGIGADGVLLLQSADPDAEGTDFRMTYFNADGSEGEMCGNGARCIVHFAAFLGMITDKTEFQTAAGRYRAEIVSPSQIRLDFPDLASLPKDIEFERESTPFSATLQIVGVPHAVVWVKNLGTYDVDRVGVRLRSNPAVGEAGANVNFAEAKGQDTIYVRTYERGVEAETLACGTGSVATAISHMVLKLKSSSETWKESIPADGLPCKYTVIPTGKERLSVSLVLHADRVSNIHLAGPARQVFETVWKRKPEQE